MNFSTHFTFNETTYDVLILKKKGGDNLFKAADIENVIRMKHVTLNSQDYDDAGKRMCKIKTSDGFKEVLFLTEVEVYSILLRSNNKIAQSFLFWAVHTARAINDANKYMQVDLEKEVEKYENEMKNISLELAKMKDSLIQKLKSLDQKLEQCLTHPMFDPLSQMHMKIQKKK